MSETTKERAAFAIWLARQHLNFDKRLTEVIYFPTDAPENEVRFLEINTGLYPEPGSPIVPIDTTPAVPDLPFQVSVADVTPEEWTKIQTNSGMLPSGWRLEGRQTIKRSE